MLPRIYLAILILVITGPAVAAGADVCKTEKILSGVLYVINNIKSYDVKVTSQYEKAKSVTYVSGAVPYKLYLNQILNSKKGKITTTTVYDGMYQWVDIKSPGSRQIYKIKLDKIVKQGRPFDTSFNIYGTGLLSGEDYLGTLNNLLEFYNLKAFCSNDDVRLSGSINIEKFRKYAKLKGNINPDYINKYSELFGFITFSVDSGNNMIKNYSMGSEKSNLSLRTTFDIRSINKQLDKSIFTFNVPKGLIVADITDDLLAR